MQKARISQDARRTSLTAHDVAIAKTVSEKFDQRQAQTKWPLSGPSSCPDPEPKGWKAKCVPQGQLGRRTGLFAHAMPGMSLKTPGAETCACRCDAGEKMRHRRVLAEVEMAARCRLGKQVVCMIRSRPNRKAAWSRSRVFLFSIPKMRHIRCLGSQGNDQYLRCGKRRNFRRRASSIQ